MPAQFPPFSLQKYLLDMYVIVFPCHWPQHSIYRNQSRREYYNNVQGYNEATFQFGKHADTFGIVQHVRAQKKWSFVRGMNHHIHAVASYITF